MTEHIRNKRSPSRLLTVEPGWYDYAELSELTGLCRKSVTRLVLRCKLEKKTFKGKTKWGWPRSNMVMVYWPGYAKYEGLSK